MIIAGTGHRPHKLNNEYGHTGPVSSWLVANIKTQLLALKPTKIISGMALGYDTILATTALSMNIPVMAAIPFIGQESMWPSKSQEYYRNILNHQLVEKYVICGGGYAPWKMQKRDEWMVDRCDLVLACYDGTTGGTANCIRYAKKINKAIVILDPKNALN